MRRPCGQPLAATAISSVHLNEVFGPRVRHGRALRIAIVLPSCSFPSRSSPASVPKKLSTAVTLMPVRLPLMLDEEVSVAVIDWLPLVLSVTVKHVHAMVAAGERVVGGQASGVIAAGELHGAHIAGGDVAVSVESSDGDRERRAGGCRGGTGDAEMGRLARQHRFVDRRGKGAIDGVGQGNGLRAGGFESECRMKTCLPASVLVNV